MTVTATTRRLIGSPPGPDSPIPALTPLRALPTIELGPEASDELRERVAYGRLHSPLPSAVQRDYHRRDETLDVPAIELTNGRLTATVLPGWGGRVWSLYDHARRRELLHQPNRLRMANFALTDAWFAGGIEWNLGSTGHWCLTARPVHAAVVDDRGGDVVLRLWEWERTRDLIWQVDLRLRGDRLVASTRVTNPDPDDKPLYWWTNIAVPEDRRTRVLAPATHAWRTSYSGRLDRVAVPYPDDTEFDISFPRRADSAGDFFFDLPAARRPFVASVDPDGAGFVETSTAGLVGRKLFLWGDGPGGRRWQRWLDGGDGRYAELQAGRCMTQLEHDRIGGGMSVAWTESFGAFAIDPADAAGSFEAAVSATEMALERIQSTGELDAEHDRWLTDVADAPVGERLHEGSGWGAVELQLRGAADGWSAALPFDEPHDDGAAATAELLAGGDPAAERLPLPGVSPQWQSWYHAHRGHWWAEYGVATCAHLAGRGDDAAAAYRASLAAFEYAAAWRGLGLLAVAADDVDDAVRCYTAARALDPGDRTLVTELLTLLLDDGRLDAADVVLDELPDEVATHGRTRLLAARCAALRGDAVSADAQLVGLEVEDLAEGGRDIEEVWALVHPGEPLPPHLDFRMS